MKKQLLVVAAFAIALAASAFTVKTKTNQIYKWFDFNGNPFQQCNPNYYAIDQDNAPDCYGTFGMTFCEIQALPQQGNEALPNLETIIDVTYNP